MPTPRLPATAGASLLDAGHDWDAIRMSRPLSLTVMGILGAHCGAVLEDPLTSGGVLYFFTPAGTSRTWDVDGTRSLGLGASVVIPPTLRMEGPGPYWRIRPGPDYWFTAPSLLAFAIVAASDRQALEQAG
ncbi:hypothetical protein [Streptomyces sp. NPDC026659]|uniref:hypothetical protein n=1 Tax=Streptomyces sp. NPDC026659 TaxID=3155123 RepID=UPI0033FE4278